MDRNQRRELTELPDYPAVRKLAAALWQQDTWSGAAIMVGAGFSRSAAMTGEPGKRLPRWSDLCKALEQDLDESGSADPLRLAEEYLAYFDKQKLHDLIKNKINDTAWLPGGLYKTLLELPWVEVLTTNWDTLLERAAKEVHYPVYSEVYRQEDLASASTPRIVKLHGTIGVTPDLVFTQEDYRRYPQEHAAFVNFVRQVFIENEICLLGFSGDDPNFLQWAGWVRDNLTTLARRIYLAGALHLTAAKRKYLESINIVPIDLWDSVSDYDDEDMGHSKANEIFLRELSSLKPKPSWEWLPVNPPRSTQADISKRLQDPSCAASLLEQDLPILASDRKSYPGWLVCPSGVHWQLQTQISDPRPSPERISEMSPNIRAELLYEIAWRHIVTYEVSPLWLVQEFMNVCDPASPCKLSKKQQLEIALHVLKNTRWLADDAEGRPIEEKATAILENNVHYWPESADELRFHQATIARDGFDYPAIEKIIEEISGEEPVCKLRKAALLAELGKYDEGEALIAEAYSELSRHHRNDRSSIHVFSRLAWADWLRRGIQMSKPGKPFEEFPSSYKDRKCSPWDHIENIREKISRAIEMQQKEEIEPLFEPGRYKDNSNSVTLSTEFHPILRSIFLFEGMSSTTGMPLRWGWTNFLAESASMLAGLDNIGGMYRFSLAIRAANSDTDDVLKKVFSRIQVACIPQDEAGHLLDRCFQATQYWTKQRSTGTSAQQRHALDRLRVFIEVLARLQVRATPEQAKSAFRLAMELGKDKELHWPWLYDPLRHLIEYALMSIPESQHHELLLDALLFPLPAEIGISDHHSSSKWPNPVIEQPGKRNPNIDRRIDEIIDRIAPCSPASGPALLRLLPLIDGFLTANEKQKIAEKIWGATPNYQTVPETGLPKYYLFQLPSPDQSATRALVRNYLFEKDATSFDLPLMADIVNAAQLAKESPDEDQAIDYFNRLVAWRAKSNYTDPFDRLFDQVEKKGEFIGEALAKSIVPSLPAQVLTEENFDKLYYFYSEVESPEAVIALVYFANTNNVISTKVERIIIRGLNDHDPNKVACSAFALLKWMEIVGTSVTTKLISRLIYLVESWRAVGLPALLWTVHQMYNNEWLSEEDVAVLTDSIPAIFDGANYKRISRLKTPGRISIWRGSAANDDASRDAISASLTRAACIRLARDILNRSQDKNSELLRVLEEARNDALPEVRFAETSSS